MTGLHKSTVNCLLLAKSHQDLICPFFFSQCFHIIYKLVHNTSL
ncbi:hypothetical protein X975_03329, partial [Stegodyphus mimosarum]